MNNWYLALFVTIASLLGFAGESIGRTKQKNPQEHRRVHHKEAYEKKATSAPHINIKVTPPEKRGKTRRVAVEIYNNTKASLATIDFILVLHNQPGDIIEARVLGHDYPPGWSAIRWLEIPGTGAIPPIVFAEVKDLRVYSEAGREIKSVRHSVDLIKE